MSLAKVSPEVSFWKSVAILFVGFFFTLFKSYHAFKYSLNYINRHELQYFFFKLEVRMLPIYVVNTDMLLLISWLVNCSVVTLVQTVRCDIGHGKEPLRGFKGNYLYHYVAFSQGLQSRKHSYGQEGTIRILWDWWSVYLRGCIDKWTSKSRLGWCKPSA